MSMLSNEPVVAAAVWLIGRASLLLGVAALLQLVFVRRISAATRHLIWTLAVVSLLLLPFASAILPHWPIVIGSQPPHRQAAVFTPARESNTGFTAAAAPFARPATSPAGSQDARAPWPLVAGAVYVIGLIMLLGRLLIQQMNVRRLARATTVVTEPEWTTLLDEAAGTIGVQRPVRLLRSRALSVPVALGIRHPAIVIPSIAETWPDGRRRAVVRHEMAHVARFDCLTQTLASAACALYWFHPAMWWVARRLRVERELACDDRVIAAGTEAREYAGHLLEIAYAAGTRQLPVPAVSMASAHQLEGRMLAALDDRRNRRAPASGTRLAAVLATAVLVACVAAVTPTSAVAPVEPVIFRPAPPPAAPDANLQAAQRIKEPRRDAVRSAAGAMGVLQDTLPGTWEIRPTETEGTVHLRIVERNSSSGSNVQLDQLQGLTAAQLKGAGGPVQFRVRRDAGTFTFEGVLRNGVGAGTFSFAADPSFPSELAKRGFARPTEREQYQMARHNVGFALIDELHRQGYGKPQTSELVRAGQHGVDASYVREMGALGHRLGSLDPLITLRDHGVGPSYIRELAELGYKSLTADELRRARDHGISGDYVRGMRDAGYGSLPMDALIRARDHGVSAEFVRGLGEAGYGKLELEQVIRVRDHGVSVEFVREMRAAGHKLPIDELVRARDHGVGVEFVRELGSLGYPSLPLDALVRLRDHGVSPEFVRELKALGYEKLAVDDLVSLRDHGLSADKIKRANERAGTRLPVDLLRSMAAGGMR